jgi:hypothetical protein
MTKQPSEEETCVEEWVMLNCIRQNLVARCANDHGTGPMAKGARSMQGTSPPKLLPLGAKFPYGKVLSLNGGFSSPNGRPSTVQSYDVVQSLRSTNMNIHPSSSTTTSKDYYIKTHLRNPPCLRAPKWRRTTNRQYLKLSTQVLDRGVKLRLHLLLLQPRTSRVSSHCVANSEQFLKAYADLMDRIQYNNVSRKKTRNYGRSASTTSNKLVKITSYFVSEENCFR